MEQNRQKITENNASLTQGIVLIRDNRQNMVITEFYDTTQKGEELWKNWIDIARRHDADGQKETTVELFEVPSIEPYLGRSDKQIMVMLDNVKPDRIVKAIEAEYAERNKVDCYDAGKVDGLIKRHPVRFRKFLEHCNPLMAKMNKPMILQAEQGEFCHSQRVFSVKDGLSFTGTDSIRSSEDVAWIFQQLGKKAVENTYCMFDNGKSRFILHSGIGNINNCLIDYAAIYKAAENFNAKRVWFIHNHPSGNVVASREDKMVWDRLHRMLGERLCEGIIINTDTGKYGIFDKWGAENRTLRDEATVKEDRYTEIPVLTFDDKIFSDKDLSYKDRKIWSSKDVAEFISTQRFGERARAGFLVINTGSQIVGNFFLPDNKLDDLHRVAEEVTSACFSCGGYGVMVYGAENEGRLFKEDKVKRLADLIGVASAGAVKLVDVVETFKDREHYSYNDEGVLAEPVQTYDKKTMFDSIDIIPIKNDTGIIRVTVDGQQLPAARLKTMDLRKFIDGDTTAEALAQRYFNNGHPWLDESRQTGFKR